MADLARSLAHPPLWLSVVLRAESPTPPPPPPPPPPVPPGAPPGSPPPSLGGPGQKSKIVAGILGILVGGLGIHRFYLGYTTMGAIMLGIWILSWPLSCVVVGWFTMMGVGIWGLVEGILILVGQPPFDKDAQGRPLIQ